MRNGSGTPAATVRVELAKLNDLPIGTGKTVRCKDLELAVFRLSDNTVRVIENRCPHKNGVLAEGVVSGHYVFCPLHDRKVDLNDGEMQKPDTGCVRTFHTTVEEGVVWVDCG
jgi:nitrite reductase (NADH) small subunit